MAAEDARTVDPCAFGAAPARRWDDRRRPEKMAELLARQILDDALDRGIEAGTPLGSEAQLASAYQVSRSTLREALRFLEVQGFVVPKRGVGGGLMLGEATTKHFARLAKLHLQARGATYGEVPLARLALEPMMARVAAESADDRGLAELREVLAEARAIETSDEMGFIANASRFHVVVARASRNTLLDLIGGMVQELHDARPNVSTPVARRAAAVAVHEAIAEAIFDGDADGAERLMREHIADTVRAYPNRDQAADRIRWT